jgi:hypothetical protein
LITSQADIRLLGLLCESKVLKPPSAEKLFYHDDIIRRILYLDWAFNNDDKEHAQKTHRCAKTLYSDLIKASHQDHSLHYFFVEWLFHVLQIPELPENAIIPEWKSMLSQVQPATVTLDDLKRAIREKLENDTEVVYLYRERFGSDNFTLLFE